MKPIIASFLLLISISMVLAVIVDHKVYEDLGAKKTATVILHFKGPQVSEIAKTYQAVHRPTERSVHADVFPAMLEANSNKHQAKTLKLLKTRKMTRRTGSDFFQLWAYNKIIVSNADHGLIHELMNSDEITYIEADREFQAMNPIVESRTVSEDSGLPQNSPQWGVASIGAPEAWAQGFSGQGVTVGVIDTGIRATHEILKSRFRASHGWFDAVDSKEEPYDDQGHGTHCAGTIAGINGYGVAPNATLIACKFLDSMGAGSTSQGLQCGQFMLCPTDPTGNNKDCSKKPKIISNSWGENAGGLTFYNEMIDSWIANGQVAIFAAGNEGQKGCSTAGSPGDYSRAIAVGATTSLDTLASFSSRGPAVGTGIIKPDVAAPGKSIRSAHSTSDTAYASHSGTSMAAPHVAGAAAIYCSQDPSLTHDQVLAKLKTGAVPLSTTSDQECGGIPDSTYPNNLVGAGIVRIPAGLSPTHHSSQTPQIQAVSASIVFKFWFN